jgi:hypothetical protein
MDKITPKNNALKFSCDACNFSCTRRYDFARHELSVKHKKTVTGKNYPSLPNENALKFSCNKCNFSCMYAKDYNIHMNTKKHKNAENKISRDALPKKCACGKTFKSMSGLYKHRHKCASLHQTETPSSESTEDVKQMVIACMQNQGFLQTIVTTLAESQTNQQENQKNQQEFQNKFLEVLPTLGTTNIQNNTFNLTTYLTIDCKDAETFNETKLRLKDYILGLDTNAFIEHAANSSSNAIMEKVIRGFYSNIEPCKRSIQTVDVARGKSYVKHDENGFILDDEGNAVNKIACAAAHHSVNHCLRYKNTMKNPDNTWKSDSIGSDYENVDNKVNNMWRFTDANETMAKKVVGNATKIDKVNV